MNLVDSISLNKSLQAFFALFIFRYTRLVINLIGFWSYEAVPLSVMPIFFAKDVTVIIPTIEPHGEQFVECIDRVLANQPAEVIVVTAGKDRACNALLNRAQIQNVTILQIDVPNKRKQIMKAVKQVRESFAEIIYDDTNDDGPYWRKSQKPLKFLLPRFIPLRSPLSCCYY